MIKNNRFNTAMFTFLGNNFLYLLLFHYYDKIPNFRNKRRQYIGIKFDSQFKGPVHHSGDSMAARA